MSTLITPAGVGPPPQEPHGAPPEGGTGPPAERRARGFGALVSGLLGPDEVSEDQGPPQSVPGDDKHSDGLDRRAEALAEQPKLGVWIISLPPAAPSVEGAAAAGAAAAASQDPDGSVPSVPAPVTPDAALAAEGATDPSADAADGAGGVEAPVLPAQAEGGAPMSPLPEMLDAEGDSESTADQKGGEARSAVAPDASAAAHAPHSEHAFAVAFVATAAGAGPGGVASVAAPAANGPAAEAGVLAERLAETVELAARRGPRELRLVLRPPELGHLDVRVRETSEGLRVAIEASSHEARALLQHQLPALRGALEARDLRVERLDVHHADVANQHLADSRGEPHGRRDAEGRPEQQWAPAFGALEDETLEVAAALAPSSGGGRYVDVRA